MRKVKQAKTKKAGANASAVKLPKQQSVQTSTADEVLDLNAAAEFLKVSKPTFYRWLAQERIKGFKAGTQWRFYRKDLQQFLESEVPVTAPAEAAGLLEAVAKARKERKLGPINWPEVEMVEEPVGRAVNTIFADALDSRASDIHIESDPESTIVRYRVDGVLSKTMRLPRDAHRAILARIKLNADMNIEERRLPQHGRIHISYQGKNFDLRPTTMPAIYGESAVIRILDQSSILIGLDKLGFSTEMLQAFEHKLREPQGLIVVAGPAGSGRTTTVYSALNLLNAPHIKIVTIENPVEYQLRGLTQVHINRKAGLDYSLAMRTFMRFDPDIIFVGDLQDLETAEACMQATMTGHLVLTAMLPSNATGVITRLIEMGVEPFLISASLKAALAQRLVRRVCEHCRTPYRPNSALLRRLEVQTGLGLSGAKFQQGKGCKECRQTGYRGRTALFELLEVSEQLRELIAKPTSGEELRRAAIESGMTTLLKDGVQKATEGLTTIEEVMRVLQGQPEGWQNPPSLEVLVNE